MNVRAVKTIWARELKVHLRDKASVASSIARSLLWLVIFGSGFGAARFAGLGVNYQQFLFPGVVAMSLIFTSMRSGISVIWDREFGFMKEILVSPASRLSIMTGKVFGGSTIATLEGMVILLLGPFFGMQLTVVKFMASVVIMFLASLSLVGLGLIIASVMKSFEGFQVIMAFIIMPMFFLSGALFPLGNMPPWMVFLTQLNPLTYGVDALRIILVGVGSNVSLPSFMYPLVDALRIIPVGVGQNGIGIQVDILVILAAAAVTMAVGTRAFKNAE